MYTPRAGVRSLPPGLSLDGASLAPFLLDPATAGGTKRRAVLYYPQFAQKQRGLYAVREGNMKVHFATQVTSKAQNIIRPTFRITHFNDSNMIFLVHKCEIWWPAQLQPNHGAHDHSLKSSHLCPWLGCSQSVARPHDWHARCVPQGSMQCVGVRDSVCGPAHEYMALKACTCQTEA